MKTQELCLKLTLKWIQCRGGIESATNDDKATQVGVDHVLTTKKLHAIKLHKGQSSYIRFSSQNEYEGNET